MLIIAGLYGVFASGLNLRLARPNLTLVQVVAPVVPGIYAISQIGPPQMRAAFMLTVTVPLLYGMLDLSLRRFLETALIYFLAYCTAFGIVDAHQPERFYVLAEWILILTLFFMLVQFGLLGGYITRLQGKLRERNRFVEQVMDHISEMAIRDELTGSFNRRRLIEVLRDEIQRLLSDARDGCRSLCLIDIDHFKAFNDAHGHLVADRVLAQCAEAIEGSIRDTDQCGRYGGEEFLVIMPAADATTHAAPVDRMSRIVSG